MFLFRLPDKVKEKFVFSLQFYLCNLSPIDKINLHLHLKLFNLEMILSINTNQEKDLITCCWDYRFYRLDFWKKKQYKLKLNFDKILIVIEEINQSQLKFDEYNNTLWTLWFIWIKITWIKIKMNEWSMIMMMLIGFQIDQFDEIIIKK